MNTKIYNKLLSLAEEIFKGLKCTDKNICLSAREISTFFENKKLETKNPYNWGVWFEPVSMQKRYTISVDKFTCTFNPEKYFTLLYKFEQLTNTPLKDRFSFSFGDGSERKEKVYTLYYDDKERCTIAKKQLLHLLNKKIAIREKGNAAKVFIYVPGAAFEWYEIMTFSDYKKSIEYYKEYLTTKCYDIVVSNLKGWQSYEGNKYNDIYLRLQDQLRANQTASEATAATHDSSTATDQSTNTAATPGSDGSQEGTASTDSSTTSEATAATHDSSTATDQSTNTAATPGSDGGQAPPAMEAKQEPPTPPPTPKPTAAARGAPYICYYAIL